MEYEVGMISITAVRETLTRMKDGKPIGPGTILVELWKCVGERAVEFRLNCSMILDTENMLEVKCTGFGFLGIRVMCKIVECREG